LRDASFLLIMHAGESLQDFVLPGSPYAETYVVELDSSLGLELPKNQELQAGTTVAMTPYSLLLLRVTSNA